MKERIKEIMTELWEAHVKYKGSRPEEEQGYLVLTYNNLFSEAVSCYRGEQAGKSKKSTYTKSDPLKLASAKQIAYAQQLVEKEGKTLKITGKETSLEISKLIESLKK